MLPSGMKRLRRLEEENAKLRKLAANLRLDKLMLQDVLTKKSLGLLRIGIPCVICRNAFKQANARLKKQGSPRAASTDQNRPGA